MSMTVGGTLGMMSPFTAVGSLGGGGVGSLVEFLHSGTVNGSGYQVGSFFGSLSGAGAGDVYFNGAAWSHAAKQVALIGVASGGVVGGSIYIATGDLDKALFWANLSTIPVGLAAGRLVPCFPAGTPIRTPDGDKPIEQLQAGDLVLSRDEHNVDAPVRAKVIEQTFLREGEIVLLRVGGEIISTTPEHPFYVKEKGWTPARVELPMNDGR